MQCYEVQTTKHIVNRHAVPGSKSYTNRALIIAALADGPSILRRALLSDDTRVAREALLCLGIPVEQSGTTLSVQGQRGHFVESQQPLDLGNSGTSTRFFTAMLTLAGFPCTITGNARMQQRPIADLLAALNHLGAEVISVHDNGCPPVRIEARCLQGGTASVSGAISSQFLSALLMVAPYARQDVTLVVREHLVSIPYVDMTLDIMASFGVQVENDGYRRFVVPGRQSYEGRDYTIEGDASSATYFWGLAALLGQEMCVTNVPPTSVQADLKFLQILERMGCMVSHQDGVRVAGPEHLQPLGAVDLNALPDAAMTVTVLAAFCKGATRIHNVANLRVKETDRLHALATELRKLGVAVQELSDGLHIDGNPDTLHGAEIATYDDHRMAMCFGMAGARLPGMRIHDPACVSKTYPGFWDDMQRLGVPVREV
ncbi:3-phosphoshikimate 1-carboxyvinyltransferase [Candidatus Entotheonellaceae bacterium PAL068K]